MTSTKILLISIAYLIFIGCGASNSSSPISSTVTNISYTNLNQPQQNEILISINKARSIARDCHDGFGIVTPAPALTWNNELYAAAFEHSTDLARSNTFSHDGSGTSSDITGYNNAKKSSFIDRIEANGYSNYELIGENIAGGYPSIDLAVEAWINSPQHCTNLMNSEFTEVGIAVISNDASKYKIYWTQSFGVKK